MYLLHQVSQKCQRLFEPLVAFLTDFLNVAMHIDMKRQIVVIRDFGVGFGGDYGLTSKYGPHEFRQLGEFGANSRIDKVKGGTFDFADISCHHLIHRRWEMTCSSHDTLILTNKATTVHMAISRVGHPNMSVPRYHFVQIEQCAGDVRPGGQFCGIEVGGRLDQADREKLSSRISIGTI